MVREGSGDPLEVTGMSGVPPAGPGGVGRPTRKSGMGVEALTQVREGSGGPHRVL